QHLPEEGQDPLLLGPKSPGQSAAALARLGQSDTFQTHLPLQLSSNSRGTQGHSCSAWSEIRITVHSLLNWLIDQSSLSTSLHDALQLLLSRQPKLFSGVSKQLLERVGHH